MSGNVNFDKELRLKQGRETYLANKVKGGKASSSAGKPRPYARANIAKARLFSPMLVGKSFTVSPRHPYLRFIPGRYYEWHIIEEGLGYIENIPIEAEDIDEHFIIKTKGKI